MIRNSTVAALMLILVATLAAQSGAPRTNAKPNDAGAGDWPMYSHDLRGNKFSPLTEITTDNAARLTQAWAVRLTPPAGRRGGGPAVAQEAEGAAEGRARGAGPAAARGGGPGPAADPFAAGPVVSNPEATPIAVNGVLYLPAAGNRVLAVDGDTGKEVWRYTLPAGGTTTARGVAYWQGAQGMSPRILFTAGARLVALDAVTGQPIAAFGRSGVIDIGVPWNGVPVIYKNLAILGATTGELPMGLPGDTRAFDVRTGKKVWEFHTVPLPGEAGHDSWIDGWRNRSGANVWTWTMTLDEERGILYMPVSGPAANYWGGDRPGNNLFANSIVAVDADNGKYRWHFQTVHHDLWDSDMSNPPTLIDITQNSRRIPALLFVGKTGYVFILDRVTGKPIFGLEERPVPKGDVPGEWYASTQPFPVKPARPLSRTEFTRERDMVRAEDTSAEHVAACQALWDRSGGFFNAGPFTPFGFHEEGTPAKSTIQLPGGTGGVNWGGAAADPETGFVYVNAHDGSLVGWIEAKKPGGNYGRGTEGSTQPLDRASADGPGPYFSFSAPMKTADGRSVTLPCTRPPWAQLVAINANTGEVAWQAPLGITDALSKEKQLTGSSGSAGPLVTAGGVVVIGATNDRRFRAFDAKTGHEVWSTQLDAAVNANPITYRGKNGKQYLAAIATDQLLAFALP
jgi:glucose dehydrogenase